MENCATVATPMDSNRTNVRKMDENEKVTFPYREAVGSLNFLAIVTRPDLAFAVGMAGRQMHNPSQADVTMVKRIFRYLKKTCSYKLRYKKEELSLSAYSDADFAGDPITRRSTSGAVLLLAGGPIAWMSKRQKTVAHSTAEAEYVAASEACREVIWQRRLIEDLVGKIPIPKLNIDNQSAIAMIHNPVLHQSTKHIDVKYHYIREVFDAKLLDPQYVRSAEQLADIFTKALTAGKHLEFCEEFNIV